MPEKTCTKCKQHLPLTSFYANKSHKDGLRSGCKTCEIKRTTAWNKANKKKAASYQRKTLYGITPQLYESLCKLQHNRCGICRIEAPLSVDHDHTTGRIRGLLCTNCNMGLGHFKDSLSLLATATTYLESGIYPI